MRRNLIAAALLAAAVSCTGGKASLYGQIREPGGPVELAEVLIIDPSSNEVVQRTVTGTGGKFAVRGALPPGTYLAEIRHKGYQTVRQTFTYPDTTSLDLTLSPQVKVQGVVRLPSQGVATQAMINFRRDGQIKVKALTDESGSYVVENLDPGQYVVEVNTPDSLYGFTSELTLDGASRVVELDVQLTDSKSSLSNVGPLDPNLPQIVPDVDAPKN